MNKKAGDVSEKARALIAQMRKRGGLPALQENIQDIFRLSSDEQTCAADLAAVIMRDCGLASNLLTAANSMTIASRAPIKTITAAITFLGFDQVYLMALAFSVFKRNLRADYDDEMMKLYASSYFSGVIATGLSNSFGYAHPEEIFVTGLFYNLPDLALAYTFPEKYRMMKKLVNADTPIDDACRQIFEVSHREICIGVVELYRIPGKIEEILVHNHRKDALLCLVEEASHLTGMLFGNLQGGRKELSKVEHRIRKLIKKESFSVTDLIRESCRKDKNIDRFFKLSDDDINMMVNVLEWGKANPAATIMTRLGIGDALGDKPAENENRETVFTNYLQELFLLRRSKPELNQMLMLAQEAIFKSFGSPEVFTAFVDPEGHLLKGRFFIGGKITVHAKDLAIPLDRNSSPIIRCFVDQSPHCWSQGDADLGLPEELTRQLMLKHALFMPLMVNHCPIGLYFLGRTEGEPFTTRDEIWLAQIVENVEIVCETLRKSKSKSKGHS